MPSFIPPKRLLMGPGPSEIHPRILSAMGRTTIGHLDPEFVRLMDDIKVLLRNTFLTNNRFTFPVSGPGSAAMEMCFANMVEEGDKVLVCVNGFFGQRMLENVIRYKGIPTVIEGEWGKAIDPQRVEDALRTNPDIRVVAFVHAETSTGVGNDAKTIADIAKRYNALTIVDAVTSLAGSELRVDEWKLDAVYAGSQKCLSGPPGISPITFSEEALNFVNKRTTLCPSWFLDLKTIMSYWDGEGGRSYHHTAPINSLYGLHEALVMFQEEGLENSWKRHTESHSQLKKGLAEMGIEYVVDESCRLPQVNAVKIPGGIDDKSVRTKLLNEFNLEIGAGLGAFAGKVWRIGLMGASGTKENVDFCLQSLKSVLK